MTDPQGFAKLVPGFEFLQNLVQNAGSALPPFGQWVAPTLNPQDLDKRIEELRTVQFWLEQNARMLGATIQAMEVQRMTLSTLQSMNVQMGDLRDAMSAPLSGAAPKPARPSPTPTPDTDKPTGSRPNARTTPKGTAASASSPPPSVDPMQWWGALTQQFTELAASAMKKGAPEAASQAASAMAKQAFDLASQSMGAAASPAKKSKGGKAPAAQKAASRKRATTPRARP